MHRHPEIPLNFKYPYVRAAHDVKKSMIVEAVESVMGTRLDNIEKKLGTGASAAATTIQTAILRKDVRKLTKEKDDALTKAQQLQEQLNNQAQSGNVDPAVQLKLERALTGLEQCKQNESSLTGKMIYTFEALQLILEKDHTYLDGQNELDDVQKNALRQLYDRITEDPFATQDVKANIAAVRAEMQKLIDEKTNKIKELEDQLNKKSAGGDADATERIEQLIEEVRQLRTTLKEREGRVTALEAEKVDLNKSAVAQLEENSRLGRQVTAREEALAKAEDALAAAEKRAEAADAAVTAATERADAADRATEKEKQEALNAASQARIALSKAESAAMAAEAERDEAVRNLENAQNQRPEEQQGPIAVEKEEEEDGVEEEKGSTSAEKKEDGQEGTATDEEFLKAVTKTGNKGFIAGPKGVNWTNLRTMFLNDFKVKGAKTYKQIENLPAFLHAGDDKAVLHLMEGEGMEDKTFEYKTTEDQGPGSAYETYKRIVNQNNDLKNPQKTRLFILIAFHVGLNVKKGDTRKRVYGRDDKATFLERARITATSSFSLGHLFLWM